MSHLVLFFAVPHLDSQVFATFVDLTTWSSYIQRSPYGHTTGFFSVWFFVCIFYVPCVFSSSASIGLASSAPFWSFLLGAAAGLCLNLDQIQPAHLPLSIQHTFNPVSDPLLFPRALLKQHGIVSQPVSQHITVPTKSFQGPHGQPPLLTATLCLAGYLARAGHGVARQLDNNFCQWTGQRIRLTRLLCPGLVLGLVGVLC